MERIFFIGFFYPIIGVYFLHFRLVNCISWSEDTLNITDALVLNFTDTNDLPADELQTPTPLPNSLDLLSLKSVSGFGGLRPDTNDLFLDADINFVSHKRRKSSPRTGSSTKITTGGKKTSVKSTNGPAFLQFHNIIEALFLTSLTMITVIWFSVKCVKLRSKNDLEIVEA